MRVLPCLIPQHCALSDFAKTADFSDAYTANNAQPARSALDIWLHAVQKTPRWIERAMDVRNAVAKHLGLKDLGRLSKLSPLKQACDYKAGERLGIFTIDSIAPDELVLFDSDRHLDVRLSLCKVDAGARVVLTTAVKTHNWLGRLYMWPVAPMHRRIVPAVLSKI